MGIVATALAGDDERVEDGSAIAGVGMTDEEPVLCAEFAGTDGACISAASDQTVASLAGADRRLRVEPQVRFYGGSRILNIYLIDFTSHALVAIGLKQSAIIAAAQPFRFPVPAGQAPFEDDVAIGT